LGSRVRFRRLIWVALIMLCLIGGAAAIRRIVAIVHPPQNVPTQLAGLDEVFASKPVLTMAHVVPGLALVVIIPFQFSRTFRTRHLRAHRWMGRVSLALALVIGVSGFALLRNPVGGATEVSAILVFDTVFLISLAKAYLHIRNKQVAAHREWMIRAMSVAVGVATVRPIMGVFFASMKVTGLTPHDFFGIAFWIGFGLTWAAGEMWIRYTRPSTTPAVASRRSAA
jgi:uncharacterized membrane protein